MKKLTYADTVAYSERNCHFVTVYDEQGKSLMHFQHMEFGRSAISALELYGQWEHSVAERLTDLQHVKVKVLLGIINGTHPIGTCEMQFSISRSYAHPHNQTLWERVKTLATYAENVHATDINCLSQLVLNREAEWFTTYGHCPAGAEVLYDNGELSDDQIMDALAKYEPSSDEEPI